MSTIIKDGQYRKFCAYGFLKNLRFFDAFFVLFFIEKGISYTEVGILYAVREIAINLFEVPSGFVSDTVGRKRTLIFALLLYILSFLVFYVGQSFITFLGAMILYGVGDAFRSGTNKGMIMDYLRIHDWMDEKVNYYGHTRSWSQKGSAMSSLIAGVLVFYNGDYQYIFLFALLPYFINLINIISYPNSLNFSSIPLDTSRKSFGVTISDFFHYLKKVEVLRIMNSSALHAAFMKSVKDYIQPLLVQVSLLVPFFIHENVTKRSGLIIGVIYFFIFLITSSASKNASRLLNLQLSDLSHKTLVLGLMCGIICGVFYIYEWYVLSMLFFIGIYVIENMRKPILTGDLAHAVSGDVLTSVLSAQSFMQSLFTIILSLIFGILADRFGIGKALIMLAISLMVFSLIINNLGSQQKKINQ